MIELKDGIYGIEKSIRPYYDPRTLLQRSERVRGGDEQSSHWFSYPSPEQPVQADHPLRTIGVMTDDACAACRHAQDPRLKIASSQTSGNPYGRR